MIEGRKNFGFALETADTREIARKFVRQNLDGDFPFELQIARTVDLTHATLSQQSSYFVRAESHADGESHDAAWIIEQQRSGDE